ncbi:MAG: Holliday junction resolvase RuvX [Candidatus Nanopelagicales bacterium]
MKKRGVRIGLDIGKVRTGISRSDESGTIVFPHDVVLSETLPEVIQKLIQEFEPITFYIGLPTNLQGDEGIAAKEIRNTADAIFATIDTPHVYVDERMTTRIAESRLRNLEFSQRDMRSKIDAMAAVVLLEDALDLEQRSFINE